MATPRRIAITLEQCWHDVPGGTATSALASVRALLVHTSLDLVGVSARHRALPPEPWLPPIPVAALPLPRLGLYEAWHRLRRPAVQRATGAVDVIHVTGMAMPPKSAPMVVTVHDLAFVHEPAHFTRRGVSFFRRAIDLARRDADVVVCPSQATIDDCVAQGFDPAKLRLVPWGTELAPVADDEVARVRRQYGLDRPYLLWAGTLEPRKNVRALVEAFERLDRDDTDLVLVGPSGWNGVALGATGARVRRVGFVPADDLAALYRGCAVFCFPSFREGFGLPVLEAMAQGAPVVTSAGTATAEVLGPDGGAGLLVDPHDAAALAGAIGAVLDDPVAAEAMRAAGRARAATYTWERTATLLASAYEDVAA